MSKQALLSFTFSEFKQIAQELGLETYRARQVWEWVIRKQVMDFASMTNLSLDVRQKLAERFPSIVPEVLECLADPDGTKKILLPLADGEGVEAVSIPDEDSLTFCLSSQIGCSIGCKFCRTGGMGFKRNLSASEILMQYFALCRATWKKPSNIVFMGMGEPFLNPAGVFGAIDLLTDKQGINLATRRITVSTAGVPKGILDLSERPGEVNLAISLHAADNETRSMLVPINKKYPLETLRRAIETYLARTSRRISFEVVLLKGINDGVDHAMNLVEFCKGLLCHVNLIRFNAFPTCGFKPASEQAEKEFRKELKKAGITATVRKSRGASILAACGQLLGK